MNTNEMPPIKKNLVKNTMGNKDLEKSYEEFAKQAGVENLDDLNDKRSGGFSAKGKEIHAAWLINNPDSSPELNNEILQSVEEQGGRLNRVIREGNQEETLATIERLKQLLSKLEQGVK
ncbi:MAG: hypothetical protein Q7K35_05805 [bacterium]|nr:hypothetical protein [bacterium]